MTSTTTRRPRPELALDEACACGERCALEGTCLETALLDDRYGIWTRDERPALRLAS